MEFLCHGSSSFGVLGTCFTNCFEAYTLIPINCISVDLPELNLQLTWKRHVKSKKITGKPIHGNFYKALMSC